MLLIHPPVSKPSEAPAGIARLAGALRSCGVPCTTLDLNLEGILHLLQQPVKASDTWTRRARKNVAANIGLLREPGTYCSHSRYERAVRDIARVLAHAGGDCSAVPGLADYHDTRLSPLKSGDLIAAAERPEQNPFFPHFSVRLREVLKDHPTNMAGISLNYLSQALCAFAIIGHLRKEHPGLTIVAGGGLVTSWMRRPGWKDAFGGLVDRWIAGPGEVPLLELAGRAGTLTNQAAPDYGDLPLREYLSPGVVLPYSASSGCYWNKCSFCPESAEGSVYLPIRADRAQSELRGLTATVKPSLLHLLDNAASPALLKAIVREPPGARWYGFVRFGQELADPDVCIALRRSGCVMLKLGLESGDQGVLDALQKGIELPLVSRALRNLHEAGIATYVYLLFGTPAESLDEARRTLAFVVAHQDAITFLNLAIFNMPLGAGTAGPHGGQRFYEGDLSLYATFDHPLGWDRKSVRRFLDREFKRHPAVAAMLRRDAPVFTSNHAAFLASAAKGACAT